MSGILITGATGMLGMNVIEQFQAEGRDDLHGVARAPGPQMPGVTWHAANLLAPGVAARLVKKVRPRIVIHLAWCTTPKVYWTTPENDQWRAATQALAEASAEAGVERFVAAGTCAEYSWNAAPVPLVDGETPLEPATPYGVAKCAAHRAIADVGANSGLSYAWARVYFLCGRHEKSGRLVPDVIAGLSAGQPVPLSEGSQRIDLVAASDVARAFVGLAASRAPGAYDIASGTGTRVRDVALRLADKLGGHDLLRFAANPAQPGPPPALVGTSDRLAAATGWRPLLDLDATLDAAIAWHGR